MRAHTAAASAGEETTTAGPRGSAGWATAHRVGSSVGLDGAFEAVFVLQSRGALVLVLDGADGATAVCWGRLLGPHEVGVVCQAGAGCSVLRDTKADRGRLQHNGYFYLL
jgi:hypothetical protein